MNRDTLISVINGFAKDGKVFSNEQDFQFELALALKNEAETEEVKLEAVSFEKSLGSLTVQDDGSLKVDKTKREYTDLIVKTKDGLYYAIELKFKGADKPYLYNSRAFGNVAVLKHGAANINSYLFLKDIARLEKINSRHFPRDLKIAKGFAIMLTNNKTYRNSNFENSMWREFPINEKRTIINNETLSLHRNDKNYKKYKDLEIKGSYRFNWEDYDLESDAMLNDKTPGFSFLVVEVDPKKD